MTFAIQFMTNLIEQLIIVRAYCKLLDMRSNVVFGVLHITGMIVAIVADYLWAVPFVRTIIMGPAVVIALPIACSRDPLRKRVLRCAIIITVMLLSAFLAYLILAALLGSFEIEGSTYASPMSAFIGLMVSVTCVGLGFEVLLALVARLEKRKDITLMPQLVLLLLWSYIISVICFTLADDRSYMVGADLSAVACIYYAFVLALCGASVALFRGDVKTVQHESQRTLTDEQSKLVRAEIDAATRRASNTRRLHHVLANKAATICELAERGDMHNAQAYLNALRDQASHAVDATSDGLDTQEQT